MAENTQVGPAGGNKPAMPAAKPKNHAVGAKDGRVSDNTGTGADPSSAPYKKVGALKPVNPDVGPVN
jgi:hypothetical protein